MATGSKKIQATKNYRLFARSTENRPLDLKKHRRLMESMKLYGFLSCFPIICYRDEKGALIVKDGQHRLAIAESLGLTVYWIEDATNFDVAIINCTAKVWALRDYAQKFSSNGKQDYQEGLEFADQHGLPIGTAFSLLGGTTSFGNVESAFIQGAFKVRDRRWADSVAGVYVPFVAMQPLLKNARFIEACMAICRVKEFDADRLIHCAERCRDKLVNYSSRDAYLDMLEEVYNFGRSKLVGLKAAATMAMRDRNVAKKKLKVVREDKTKAS